MLVFPKAKASLVPFLPFKLFPVTENMKHYLVLLTKLLFVEY